MTEEAVPRVMPSDPDTSREPDPRIDEILDLFAHEARIERSRLRLDARADELGITSLDLALALFELESRYDIALPEPVPGDPMPTVGEMVEQVLAALRMKTSVTAPAPTPAPTPAPPSTPAPAPATASASAASGPGGDPGSNPRNQRQPTPTGAA